jgi:galactokinase
MNPASSQVVESIREELGRLPDPVLRVPAAQITSAPARIDVLGGLASEAGGAVAQMSLPRRATLGLAWQTQNALVIKNRHGFTAERQVHIDLQGLLTASELPTPAQIASTIPAPEAWAYSLPAVFYVLAHDGWLAALRDMRDANGGRISGATLVIESGIPAGSGQASSTAMTAALLQAVVQSLHLTINTLDKAGLIHRAESLFAPTSAHIVDALTALGAQDGPPAHLLRYSTQPNELLGQISLPENIRIMALDTGVRTTRSNETVRLLRLAGAMGLRIIETIYRDLGQQYTPLHGYLGNVRPGVYRRYFRTLLPRRLRGSDFLRTFGVLAPAAGQIDPEHIYRVRAAVDHLMSEHEHAENFLQAMEELCEPPGGALTRSQRGLILRRAGRLMLASQHSYRLRLGLSCPEADWLIQKFMEIGSENGIYGARISECGGGGTVVVLMENSSQATDALLGVISEYPRQTGFKLDVQPAGAQGSAGALLWNGDAAV